MEPVGRKPGWTPPFRVHEAKKDCRREIEVYMDSSDMERKEAPGEIRGTHHVQSRVGRNPVGGVAREAVLYLDNQAAVKRR